MPERSGYIDCPPVDLILRAFPYVLFWPLVLLSGLVNRGEKIALVKP